MRKKGYLKKQHLMLTASSCEPQVDLNQKKLDLIYKYYFPRKPTHPLNNDGLEDDFPFENASIRKAEKTPSFSTREPAPACAARLSACDQRQKHYVTPRFRPAPWEGLGPRLRLHCTLVFLEILIWDTSCLDLLGTKLLGFQPDLKFQMEKM